MLQAQGKAAPRPGESSFNFGDEVGALLLLQTLGFRGLGV